MRLSPRRSPTAVASPDPRAGNADGVARTAGSVHSALSPTIRVRDPPVGRGDAVDSQIDAIDTMDLLVGDVMTIDPVVVAVDASIEDAAHLLQANSISGLPVVDPRGAL